jgi:hypothetical protein
VTGSAIGYTITNQDTFDTLSFVETTAVGGVVGGISASIPINGLGVAAKGVTHIAGAETLYALQTNEWTVEGAQQAAMYGVFSAGVDVGLGLYFQGVAPKALIKLFPTNHPQRVSPNTNLVKIAARYRSGMSYVNSIANITSGATFMGTTWFLNKKIRME